MNRFDEFMSRIARKMLNAVDRLYDAAENMKATDLHFTKMAMLPKLTGLTMLQKLNDKSLSAIRIAAYSATTIAIALCTATVVPSTVSSIQSAMEPAQIETPVTEEAAASWVVKEQEFSPPSIAIPNDPVSVLLADPMVTDGQKAALRKAASYIKTIPVSKDRLIEILVENGYGIEDSIFAADNCNADWDEQADWRVATYFTFMGFSYKDVVEQLLHDKFTEEQAYRAADNCNADWSLHAQVKAKAYIKTQTFKDGERSALVAQLVEDGFSLEDAEEAVSHVWFT